MKKFAALTLLAAIGGIASAQINSFFVQNGWNNNTGTFTYSGTFPQLTMNIANQSNTANNTFGERFIAWLSTDGTTRAKINGKKDFAIEYSINMDTDAAATRDVEAGLLFQYGVRNPGPNQFFPTSQYYAKYKPQIEAPVIQTSSDWCLPFHDFAADGATLLDNQTVHMKFEYDYNDTTPNSSVQRLGYRNNDGTWFYSPWINGNWGGAVYDNEMELGIYFQPLVEPANPTHTTNCNINLISFSGTLAGAAKTVSGNVGLNAWAAAVSGRSVTFRVYNGTTLVQTATGILNSSGAYSFPTTLANGNYTVIADAGRSWLLRKTTVTVGAAGATGANFTLPNGDIVNDGIVDIADYSALAGAFDATPTSSNWLAAADITGDEIVDIADYAGLALAFDLLDDNP